MYVKTHSVTSCVKKGLVIMNEGRQPKYKRVLLKLSGEALRNNHKEEIYDMDYIHTVSKVIKKCVDAGVEIAIIVGAGNIWRGKYGVGMDRVHADHMGMLATAINTLALRDVFAAEGIDAVAMTAVTMHEFAEPYTRDGAIANLEAGKVVIFGCGFGSPFFTTDTAAVLRAAEIGADVVMMAKNIDGIYDSDPKKNPDAKKYDTLDYETILTNHLAAIDATAAAFCMDNDITVHAFGLNEPNNIYNVIMGDNAGTVIKGGTAK